MLVLLALTLAQEVPGTRLDWAWLTDTWWIVPSFEMQMSTGNRSRTARWAHRVQGRRDDPEWTALPGFTMGLHAAMERREGLKGPG